MRIRLLHRSALLLALGLSLAFAPPARAQEESFALIRDAEIESTIREFSAPVFQAAGLSAGSVKIHIVVDPRLNAFVAGGMQMFLNTGLIQRAEHPGQLVGVIAHEAGHIAGGHLSRLRDELAGASTQSILAAVLGAAAAVASGRGEVGAAVTALGQSRAHSNLLQYSQVQESSADQAGLRYLDVARISSRGFKEFLEQIADQELLSAAMQDPYLRTHPITQERVDVVHRHVERSPWADEPLPEGWEERHARMRAKLDGFLESPGRTFRRYPESDQSIAARYARAIAHHKRSDVPRALAAIDDLLAERPDDPYFRELRGQVQFEHGRVREALADYQKAHDLAPHEPLITAELARVGIETGDPEWLDRAVSLLTDALRRDPDNTTAWRHLGIAHGRSGRTGQASLALAEEAMRRGHARDAQMHATRAQDRLDSGSPAWIRAEDIRLGAERALERVRR